MVRSAKQRRSRKRAVAPQASSSASIPPKTLEVAASGGTKSIAQFCASYGFSRSFYYKMQHDGLGPTEIRLGKPGKDGIPTVIRITARAEAEWLERAEQRARSGDV